MKNANIAEKYKLANAGYSFLLHRSKSSDTSEVRNTASYFLNDHHLYHYYKIIADMILRSYIYLKTEYQLNQ